MAVRELVNVGDPVLRTKSEAVIKVSQKIKALLADMADTMYAALGVGLAAPQVGISKRVIVVDVGEGLLELVNPKIVSAQGEDTKEEGCLSVPGLVGEVTRAAEVVVRAQDGKGRHREITATGLLARALQHEIDHLEGVLFIDRAHELREVGEAAETEE